MVLDESPWLQYSIDQTIIPCNNIMTKVRTLSNQQLSNVPQPKCLKDSFYVYHKLWKIDFNFWELPINMITPTEQVLVCKPLILHSSTGRG